MSDVTQLLAALKQGQSYAADELLPLVYQELRKLAHSKLLHEKPGQTLQPTALVHEAFVRLVDVDCRGQWDSRGHFFAAAAEAMRRILIENARRKARTKHGGDFQRVEMPDLAASGLPGERLLEIDEALTRFAAEEPEMAKLVQLRYFAGMQLDEAADVLGISRATAVRHWTYARAWLFDALGDN
jgi:RNA polymerase sigma factor (TIGR02999 family)